ncbi:4'-phosphopantetheinyl transferase family protein [Streptomyces oceani]|uniref:4'-phosphopantetheinyl transferase family protein n=1 Tax=Streptomyces oceani TaxID=1075402 RepID=UPI001FCCE8C7|nr:hypothetical protein [Streptomyces oceani]
MTVRHLTERLTLAVVSIAWLRKQSDATRAGLERRHLSPQEAAYATALPVRRRRDEWLAGRFAIKHCVTAHQRRHRGVTAATREVRVDRLVAGMRSGKPVVDVPVEVGLSHSGDFAVAACGPHAIGVDVEHRTELPPLVRELLDGDGDPSSWHSGVRRLASMPEALRWACREAVLKHYAVGLRVNVREVVLTRWEPDGRFHWRAGPELLRQAPADGYRPLTTWAGRVDGYSLALVWQY